VVGARRPCRRDELAGRDRPRVDPEAVVPRPAADEALRKRALLVALRQRGGRSVFERDQIGQIEVYLCQPGLGHEGVAVTQLDPAPVVLPIHFERALQWRREPERDLGGPVQQ
jgi:hypothetical protein